MNQLRQRLNGHTIICGFGVKGRAIVQELLAHGQSSDEIVVIDPDEAAAREAAAQNLVGLHGNASAESILRTAALEKAGHVIVAPNRDDACVLICLPVRSLAPSVRVIASAREDENIKLIYRAGADVVVAPSVSGGRLMAKAVRQEAVTRFLEDLLSFGRGVDAAERVVRPEETGRQVTDLADLADTLILGIARGDERLCFSQLQGFRLQAGDRIVYLTAPNMKSDRELL